MDRKRKSSKKSKEEQKIYTGPVVFQSEVDLIEISAILLNKLDSILKDSSTLAFNYGDADVDIGFFAEVLKANFSNKTISELMNSNYGQGILMGYIMAEGEAISRAERAEEGADDEYY